MAALKENEFIDTIKKEYCVNGFSDNIYGIGDDCAVFNDKHVITCDMLVEGTHFDLSMISPYDLGVKSALVNISDVTSMGGLSKYAVISVGYSTQSREFLCDLYKGMYDEFVKAGAKIIGGDTVRSEKFVINVTLIGEADNPIMRSGAKVGDAIIISDYAGLSHAGLDVLFKYGKSAESIYPELVKSHVNPRVNPFLGNKLSLTGKVHAMMDISDGISKDLKTLCEASQVGAVINTENFIISPYLLQFCEKENKNINDYILGNFEDYTLLITCAENNKDKIMSLLSEYGTPSCIGAVTEKDIIVKENGKLYNMPISWEHF